MKPIEERKIKCVVWDLDNTLWDGVLLEDKNVTLRQEALETIKTLDSRGILHSVASKNDFDTAMSKIEEFGLKEYFLYPKINWNPKSDSVLEITKLINIGIDTIAFIDDQPFERDEVSYALPDVLCIDSLDISKVPRLPEMMPRFITEDSKNRRHMYMADICRNKIENEFKGPQEEFLAGLNMVFTISKAKEEDLKRAEELTVRTHQLNTTGYTYSYEELDRFRKSDNHKLLIASLTDKYGSYGKIGLVLLECVENLYTIKLLLMSCRVMSRGVGSIMINHIRNMARKEGAVLRAIMVPSEVNRMMYVTYKFSHFTEIEESDSLVLFENDLTTVQDFPEYVDVKIVD